MKTGLKRRIRRVREMLVEAKLDGTAFLRVVRSNFVGGTRSATGRRRILVVDELLPDARFGAGYPRAAEILLALVEAGWDVTMYPLSAASAEHAMMQERFAGKVRFVPSRGAKGLQWLMRENLHAFEVTLISRPATMQIYTSIRARLPAFRTYCIYDAEAIFAARDRRRLGLFGTPMSDEAYERALDDEIAIVAAADALATVTEAEAMLFRARTAKPVGVIRHAIAVRDDTGGFAGRADLLFVGRCTGSREYSPNVDSLHWFVDEVMPLIDAGMGTGYRLLIVGLADAAIVAALASERVVFMGVVDDLDAVYDRCRVFVAPTRYAAGLPLKVVEAAAAGIPCVVTSLLAEQLGFKNDVELVAAGDAVAFADGCIALHEQPDRWVRIRDAARSSVTDDYSRARFGAAVRAALTTTRSQPADA